MTAFSLRLAGGIAICLSSLAGSLAPAQSVDPVDAVDPFIGVRGAGSTVVGPTLPHGSIHPSPDTPEGKESGYKMDQPIRGFSQLHASGTGWGRYGNLMLSPQVGLNVAPDGHDSPKTEEKARAFAYQVRLARYDILTEMTPTRHAVIYRFTFPATDQANLSLDLGQQIPGQIGTRPGDGKVDNSVMTMAPDHRTFSGSSRYAGGFGGGNYTVYFYGQIDQAPVAAGTWKNQNIAPDSLTESWAAPDDRVGGWWRFATSRNRSVQVKMAVSLGSVDRAKSYLESEIPGWNFDDVRAAARQAWSDALGRIEVAGGDSTQRTLFYTALYHAQIMPRDRTGDFERFPAAAPMWDDFYATWDVWRTEYPLMLLIQPDMVRGSIASFVQRLQVDGQVRDAFISGYGGKGLAAVQKSFRGEWDTNPDQGGNDVDNIIADAYVKGLGGVDWSEAYGVLKFDADHERQGNFPAGADDYRHQGWIRAGTMSVSNTLEYAYNDFCAAEVARGLGKADDAKYYAARSHQWQHLFNPDLQSDGFNGFTMPRTQDGSWPEFDPKKYPGSWKDYYYEASSWTYSMYTPHQMSRLIELMGGREMFVKRLDYGNANKLIDYSNEPAFLAPVLFHYAARPDLSAKWIRQFIQRGYSLKGTPGDDDSGAMSAYYIWASMGLFPNAGQDIYFLTGPLFDRIVIHRPEDESLTITREGKGNYVASVTLNGQPLTRAWIHHGELKGKTVLAFTMSETPTDWGTQDPPPSDGQTAQAFPP